MSSVSAPLTRNDVASIAPSNKRINDDDLIWPISYETSLLPGWGWGRLRSGETLPHARGIAPCRDKDPADTDSGKRRPVKVPRVGDPGGNNAVRDVELVGELIRPTSSLPTAFFEDPLYFQKTQLVVFEVPFVEGRRTGDVVVRL